MPPVYSKCFPWLTFTCVLLSLPILALSMINFCALILYLNAGASACTILFHTTILVFGWYRSRPAANSTQPKLFIAYSRASILLCLVILALWIVAFAVSVQLTVQGPQTARPFAAHALWNTGIHIGILVLTACICLAKGLYLHTCFLERRRFLERPSPPVDQERGVVDIKPLPPNPLEKPAYNEPRKGSVSAFSADEAEEAEKRDSLCPLGHVTMSRKTQPGSGRPRPHSLTSKVRINLKKPSTDLRWAFVTPTGGRAPESRGSIVRESALWD
ncbi:hypothetical protein BJ165DRAFT_406713 [Panaeolus papilionaceus]|nr:hypothetical protein BJ165DRAFT_406713 [Panaeolus papilionaceus]